MEERLTSNGREQKRLRVLNEAEKRKMGLREAAEILGISGKQVNRGSCICNKIFSLPHPFLNSRLSQFSHGLAIVKIGRATGYIDKTGRYLRIL